jgi:hypothetical protein
MARHWIQFSIGFWLIVSPWLLGFAEISVAKWSNVLIGLALVIMGGWEIFGGKGRSVKK